MVTEPKNPFIQTRYPDFPRYPHYLNPEDRVLRHIWSDIGRWAASLIRIIGESDTKTIFFVTEDKEGSIQVDGRIRVAEVGVSVTPVAGDIRYNTSTNKHQGYNGTSWNNMY